MSIVTIVEKAFAGLLALLSNEAARHQRQLGHLHSKARHHRGREQQAIQNMQKAGAVYRNSLYREADKHEEAMDKANALAAKIAKVME